MRIVDFKADMLDEISKELLYLDGENLYDKLNIILEGLKNINISFVIDGCNRLQSTLLCELGDSYVQQSQRYVNYKNKTFYIPQEIKSKLLIYPEYYDKAINLITKSFDLYMEMTELKDPDKKGRLKNDDFKYGIPSEDARYILPLTTTTGIQISMSGDKLLDLIRLCIENKENMIDIYDELRKFINPNFLLKIYYITCVFNKNTYFIPKKFKDIMNTLSKDNNIIPINLGYGNETVAKGALQSQNEECPFDIYNSWNEEKEIKSEKLIQNVAGFGHTGIFEHTRSTFAMECSLSAYHQVIRHRLQKLQREDIFNIPKTINFDNFYVPESIKNSIFYDRVVSLFNEYREFYDNEIEGKYLTPFLLNGDMIKFINSSNARNDNWIFRERLCLTAQTEIRELFNKKFEYLMDKHPNIYKYGFPPCITTGKCKEGKLCCGKIEEMKEKYKKYI